jgi:hypothetical protein
MSKKILVIFVSILLLAAIPITLFVVQQRQELRQKAAPATSLSFSPNQLTKAVGDEFEVDVVIDTGDNAIGTVIMDITFDPTKLQFLSISNSAYFPNTLSESGDGQDGHIHEYHVRTNDPSQPFSGVDTVATIRFRSIAPTDNPISLSFTDLSAAFAYDEGATNLLISTPPATMTITGEGATQPTLPAVPPTSNDTPSVTPETTVTISPSISPSQIVQATISPTATASAGTVTPSPTAGPLNLTVTSPANGGSTADTTPTITGNALADTNITLTFSPGGLTGVTTTDSTGEWSFTPQTALGNGVYTLSVTGVDPVSGDTQVINSSLTIGTVSNTPIPTSIASQNNNGTTPRPTQISNEAVPVTGSVETTIAIIVVGLVLLIGGASLPFFLK